MGVVICLPLFGPPGRELEDGKSLQGRQLRTLAAELAERLGKAAELLDKLAAAGWSARVAEFDALVSRDGIETHDDAVRRLQEAGVAPDEFLIVEDPEEDEE
jgi:hypothetical protein